MNDRTSATGYLLQCGPVGDVDSMDGLITLGPTPSRDSERRTRRCLSRYGAADESGRTGDENGTSHVTPRTGNLVDATLMSLEVDC